jgi:SAM-dependent methyltransferase
MGGNTVRLEGGVLGSNELAACDFKPRKPLAFLGLPLVLLVFIFTIEGALATGRMYPPRGRNPSLSSVGNRSLLNSTRSALRQYIKAFGNAPFIYPVVNTPCIKSVLSALPGARALYGSKWDRKHPFDRQYGTDTSGFLCGEEILTGHPAEEHGSPYAGVQPSVLRTALATLPGLEKSTFIDLGCGKGRPMLIASEFPFHDIAGVELSPSLADAARRNAAVIARNYPLRTPIRVEIGDATVYPLPAGDVVLFIYNSFDRELMLKVAENVEAALTADRQRSIFVVFCNPVSGDCFDALPLLTRRFAQTLPYTPEEQNYAEDAEDAVIIWQGGNAAPPIGRADARIVIVKERWRAELRA